jgi:NAD(P)-dependent dehydrogenase (short-subunit alcohol dehydrogenase family)
MTKISRRSLMGGAAATGALVAAAAYAQTDVIKAKSDLKGTSILITGTSSGFGRLAAEDYARKGAKVFATMRNLPRPEADELTALAEAEGLDLHIIEIDVTDDQMVFRGVAEAERIAGGGIDVLINNAGIGIVGPVEVQDMEATKLAFDTNVFGYQRMIRAALPGMRAKKSGHIFYISSQLGRVIVPGAGHYGATKFAVEAMGEQLAYELVPHNIGVTVIEPGGYPTKVWVNRNRYTADLKARAGAHHLDGYPQLIERMGTEDGSGRDTDPMDIPNAMAEILAMPAQDRTVRKAVHPRRIPQAAINEVSAKTQVEWLGGSAFGPMVKAVHNV